MDENIASGSQLKSNKKNKDINFGAVQILMRIRQENPKGMRSNTEEQMV